MKPHEEFAKEHAEDIALIISEWIPKNTEHFTKKQIAITKWFGNFQSSEYSLALKLLEKIQYYSDKDIEEYIEILAKHIARIFGDNLSNVLFYPLGDSSASSGSQFLYQYKHNLGLNDENFRYGDFREHLNRNIDIVFFDDIIGSGKQATTFFNNNLKGSKAKCHYIALLGFENGINTIKTNTEFTNIIVYNHLSNQQMAFDDKSYFFKDRVQRDEIKKLCQKYGEILYPKHPLGYDDSQALIVFCYNTPNNTLPVIWANHRSESNPARPWHPVWAREKKTKQEQEQKLLDGALIINNQFLSGLEKEQSSTFEPYQFYTSKINDDCQWYGILKNWDIKRNVLDDLTNQIKRSFDSNIDMKVSAIVSGSGGCGKSTLLRRVAVNLANSDLDLSVVWITNASDFLKHSLSSLRQMHNNRCLVIIEDWYRLNDVSNDNLYTLFKELISINNIRLLIGDRDTDKKKYMQHLFNPNNNLYKLTNNENNHILQEIAEQKVPKWKSTFALLQKATDYKSITLFLFLFILAKNAESNESGQIIEDNLLSQFRHIVQSDVKKISVLAPGIAKALIWWAKIYKNLKLQLSELDFYLLADFFGKTHEYSNHIGNLTINSKINELLRGYIKLITANFKSQGNIQLLIFNHDTLAEEGLCYIELEEDWHICQSKVLDFTVENLSDNVASRLLAFLLNEKDFFADKNKKISLIEKLNARKCAHHYHLNYLIQGYDISHRDRIKNAIELLEQNKKTPLAFRIVPKCLTILEKYDFENAKKFAIELLEQNKKTPVAFGIIPKCLTILKKYDSKML